EKVKQIVNKGIPLKKGDKLYCVYASDIDYHDGFLYIIDSIEKAENTYYDTEPQLIARYVDKDKADEVAEDLHQTILRGTKLSEFCRRYRLTIDMHLLKKVHNHADEILMCKFHHNKLNILELNNFCITNNIPKSTWENDSPAYLYRGGNLSRQF
ncbi:MAG: hypothetical protein WBF90_22435, partial [Rivularia sp. (in: cyanobacteria)]